MREFFAQLRSIFLSTPSGWRATVYKGLYAYRRLNFYPRPPGGGRLETCRSTFKISNFYPRPPGGGRRMRTAGRPRQRLFLSTPSGRRATEAHEKSAAGEEISIHALRVEGDLSGDKNQCLVKSFLSTPSGWRATSRDIATVRNGGISIHALRVEGDAYLHGVSFRRMISIHALRVEGDFEAEAGGTIDQKISIHALRVEGDRPSGGRCSPKNYFYPRPPGGGRPTSVSSASASLHFYPRPPGGGRPRGNFHGLYIEIFLSTPSGWRATATQADINRFFPFLSTPSGWRATCQKSCAQCPLEISIHALRVEGDAPRG